MARPSWAQRRAPTVLQLDVSLAGQNPSGLAQAVGAISTPGSPDYRHYLTPAQFASEFGPSAGEVAQVSSVLRGEGLTVGQPLEGSVLLPVSGSVAAVESAFGTTMQSVQAPGEEPALVNTSAASIPASLSGLVTGVAGLNGLDQQRNMLKVAPGQPLAAPPGSPGNLTPAVTAPSPGASRARPSGPTPRRPRPVTPPTPRPPRTPAPLPRPPWPTSSA